MSITKVRVVAAVAAISLGCLGTAACGGGGSGASSAASGKIGEGQTLVVGGPQSNIIETIQASGFDEKFKQETGADIQWIPGQAPDNLTKLVQSKGGAPPFDVVFLDNVQQLRAVDAEVVQKIDISNLTDSGPHLPDSAFPNSGYGPAWIAIRLGSCINTASYQSNGVTPPTGIDGWFDPKLGQHITLPSPNNFYWLAAMPAIAQNYGVALDDPQPLVDRFKQIDAQSFFTSSSDAQTALQSGDVWLAPITDGRCLGLKIAGQPVDFLPLNLDIAGTTWPYVGLLDTWDVVAGSDKSELGTKFIDMVLSDAGTKALLEQFGYVPARTDLQEAAKTDPKVSGLVADFDYSDVYVISDADLSTFLDNLRPWTDTWTQAFSG